MNKQLALPQRVVESLFGFMSGHLFATRQYEYTKIV